MLSLNIKFGQTDRQTDGQLDGQTDGQTDNGKTICPPIFRYRGIIIIKQFQSEKTLAVDKINGTQKLKLDLGRLENIIGKEIMMITSISCLLRECFQ